MFLTGDGFPINERQRDASFTPQPTTPPTTRFISPTFFTTHASAELSKERDDAAVRDSIAKERLPDILATENTCPDPAVVSVDALIDEAARLCKYPAKSAGWNECCQFPCSMVKVTNTWK